MRQVAITHEPIVPAIDGQPPAFVVACLESGCGFAVDAHGLDANDAIASVAPSHAEGHRLVARAVDYAAPVFGPTHVLGRPVEQEPHPLYRKVGG